MPVSRPALLWYRTVRGKEYTVYFSSAARARVALKNLKKQGIIQTYNKGRCARALISPADRCPFCTKVMIKDNKRDEIVPVLNNVNGRFAMAHRSCCEKAKVAYRHYDASDKKSPNKVIHPK